MNIPPPYEQDPTHPISVNIAAAEKNLGGPIPADMRRAIEAEYRVSGARPPKPAPKRAPPDRDAVTALHAAVMAADAAIGTAAQVVDDLRERHKALAKRRSDHEANQPQKPADFDQTHVDALLADPSADPLADHMAGADKRTTEWRKKHDAWQAQASLIDQALSRSSNHIATAEKSLTDSRTERDRAWAKFVQDAHDYLISEFRTALNDMSATIIEPMQALFSLGTISKRSRHLDPLSKVKVQSIGGASNSGSWNEEVLLDGQPRHLDIVRTRSAAIDRFRATLT